MVIKTDLNNTEEILNKSKQIFKWFKFWYIINENDNIIKNI